MGAYVNKQTNRRFNFPFTENVSQIDRDYHFVCKQTNKFTDCVWVAYLHMTNACFHTTMFTFYILHVCTWNARSNKRAEYFHITGCIFSYDGCVFSYDGCVFSYDDEHFHVTMHIFI